MLPPSGFMTSIPLDSLVLLYLYVAYRADNDFDSRERQAVIALASRWAPHIEPGKVTEVVDAAFAATRSGQQDAVDALAQDVGVALTPEERLRVLGDLGMIARADGYLSTSEVDIISRVRTIWGGL